MQELHIEALDLNLLVALRALLTEKHVTRAAARVGLSQPAMSHALARLRELLGDALLVRTPTGMQPTLRAEAILGPLDRALSAIEAVLASPAPFAPSRSTRQFRIATNDYMELVLFPPLLARLWAEAPGIDVRVKNLVDRADEDLEGGKIDLAMGLATQFGAPHPRQGLRLQTIVSDRFVCVVREGHPTVKKRLSLEQFVALPHALVAPRGESGSIVDAALATMGKRRRVAVEVPHFLVAPHVVRETDVVLTLAARVAKSLGPLLGLRQLAPPIELEGFSMSMAWHERHHADAAHAWLRGVITEVAKGL